MHFISCACSFSNPRVSRALSPNELIFRFGANVGLHGDNLTVAQFTVLCMRIPIAPGWMRKQPGPGGLRIQDGVRGIRAGWMYSSKQSFKPGKLHEGSEWHWMPVEREEGCGQTKKKKKVVYPQSQWWITFRTSNALINTSQRVLNGCVPFREPGGYCKYCKSF